VGRATSWGPGPPAPAPPGCRFLGAFLGATAPVFFKKRRKKEGGGGKAVACRGAAASDVVVCACAGVGAERRGAGSALCVVCS
jgi:hypothetical protein